MLPLLSPDLFGGVKTDDEGGSFTFPPPLAEVKPEPLPPERYEEQTPELTRTEHEPTDIPSAEFPMIRKMMLNNSGRITLHIRTVMAV